MIVTLTKQQVARIVAFAGAILPRKASVPALAHALFEPDGAESIKVTLADLEQTLSISLTPERLAGAPARFLFPVAELKALKADTVTLQPMAADSVACTASVGGRALARTVTVPPVEDFPELSNPGELADCDLGAFLRAYRGTAFAAHPDPGRQALHAVYADPERCALVATDGHRLALRPIASFPLPGEAVLPLTKMLLKQFPEAEQGRIGLFGPEDDRRLALATGDILYTCRCPDVTFPNYRQVIPDTAGHTASLVFGPGDREAVESLLPYLDKAMLNGLFLFGKDGAVVLGVEGTGGDPLVLPLPECRCENTDGLAVPVSGVLLAEALKQGFTHIRVAQAYTPMVFDDGADGLHLLMPLRGEPSAKLLQAAGMEASQQPAATIPEPESQPEPVQKKQPEESAMPSTPVPTPQPKPATPVAAARGNLSVVPPEDPLVRLEERAGQNLEQLQQALAGVKELKRQVRAVRTQLRIREREIESREREMEKSRNLIQRLQEAIAA